MFNPIYAVLSLSYVYRSAKYDAKFFNFSLACLFYFTVQRCTNFSDRK